MKNLHLIVHSILFFLFSFFTFSLEATMTEEKATKKLKSLHSRLSLMHGYFYEEYPEQLMATMFLSKKDRVLELGGNIGRNSCIIGSLLSNSKHLVVLETDPKIAKILKKNRDLNHLSFKIENSAISHVPLIQTNWVCSPLTEVTPDYFLVNTLTYQELKNKYEIPFNVLVADCEGALYSIFQDDESLLDDVSLIITENDYLSREAYEDVRAKFIQHGFELIYNIGGGWGHCADEFYQVWKKPSH